MPAFTKNKTAAFQGGCLCGAIRYEADRIEPKYAHCHCSMCRKFHGAAFSTFGAAKRTEFRWLKGESQLRTFTASNKTSRQFCRICGSSLTFATPTAPKLIEFSLATLDQHPPLAPDAHLHLESKVDWLDLSNDPLPKYRKDRDEND